jgi:4a-hydroxytetrahydrobiopterin dehydratase
VVRDLTPRQFQEAQGVADWRVVSGGALAYYRTGSFAAGAMLVVAIAELPGLSEHRPDVDLRPDGVSVRLNDDWMGLTEGDVEMARRISEAARQLSLTADPTAVQTVSLVVGTPSAAEVLPFWQACSAIAGARPAPMKTCTTQAHEVPGSGSRRWTSHARMAAGPYT